MPSSERIHAVRADTEQSLDVNMRWGGGDYRDLMTGVDRVIEMVLFIQNAGVMGWRHEDS